MEVTLQLQIVLQIHVVHAKGLCIFGQCSLMYLTAIYRIGQAKINLIIQLVS